MTERSGIVQAIPEDFWSLVKHGLDFKDPATQDSVRKVAFGVMRRCSREEAQEIQNFLNQNGIGT
ncbi:MAG: hypothetical protein V4449_02800 [Patescibacteria group bacterium]